MDKQAIRQEALKCRNNIDLSDESSDDVCKLFKENFDLSGGKNIALYWPMGRELTTFPIMDEISDFLLPVILEDSRKLKFARFQGEDRLEESRYGVYQPVIDEKTEFLEPDIVVVPMLAFDRKGYRLGYGGGYYDCTIRDLRKRKKCLEIVGIAYSKQACLFLLPKEEHDEKMDYIITPKEIISFK